ncbi:hypothetical protein ACOME3_009471 [Neoechinorhynchus agilis]
MEKRVNELSLLKKEFAKSQNRKREAELQKGKMWVRSRSPFDPGISTALRSSSPLKTSVYSSNRRHPSREKSILSSSSSRSDDERYLGYKPTFPSKLALNGGSK